ncbi:MAG: hypothetical protein HOK41_05870 [Nitrospina sp.]|jgi:hypothetical protein|nr:hypothetical protein [Nitrospina sp.]MBT6718352.1 hypothetical protein [Nitrospina sp.]
MFDISENGKEEVMSYLKKAFGDRKNNKYDSQKDKNVLDNSAKKGRLQNLILAKSLIVKL